MSAVCEVLGWLGQQDGKNKPWMVVIDNVDESEWSVRQIVPKHSHGNLIIMSRASGAKELLELQCRHMHFARMEPTEAQSLLLRHVQEIALGTDQADVMSLSSTIAERLDYLSFALDLAGAWISSDIELDDKSVRAAMKDYLAHFDTHRERLFSNSSYQGLSAHDKTVRTV